MTRGNNITVENNNLITQAIAGGRFRQQMGEDLGDVSAMVELLLQAADRGLVLVGKFLVDVLVHQARLAAAGVAKNDDLEQDFLAVRHGAGGYACVGGGG